MDPVFTPVPLIKPGLLLRLLHRQPTRNALLEVKNLLASKPVLEVSLVDVYHIALKYRVNMAHRFGKELQELYSSYYLHCLTDRSLSVGEVEQLKHLKVVLGLADKAVAAIHDQGASEVYRSSVQQVLADGQITPEEASFLQRLQEEVKLPDDLAAKILAGAKTAHLNDFIKQVGEDDRLTPAEERELELLSAHLGITLDAPATVQLQRLKLYWLIENGQIPVVEVDLNLQHGEECYFTTDVQWYEQRTVTQRVNYHGPTARIKITKGVYYRFGSFVPQRVTAEEWKLVDTGRVYLTNKQLIFMGSKKNSNIKLTRILSFTPYSDGVGLQKDAGRSPMLHFKTNVEVFSMILSRLLD